MQEESIDRAAQKAAVVDLLATWGATALPGMAELFEVLASPRQRGGLEYLQQLLDAPEIELDPGLRVEVQALLEASRTGAIAGPEFDRRAAPIVQTVRAALAQLARARREAVGERLGRWTPALEANELQSILDQLWPGEPARDLAGDLLEIRQLNRANELLDGATTRIGQGMVSSLQPRDGSVLDPEIAGSVHAALESKDPVRMVQAWLDLGRARSGPPAMKDADVDTALQRRLAETCQRARRTAEDSGPLLGEHRRELLLAASRSCAALLQTGTDADGVADGAARSRTLTQSERKLSDMLEDLSDLGETARHKRLYTAQALIHAWRSLAAGLDQTATAADHLERTLLEGLPAGGSVYYEALCRGAESIRSLRQASVDHAERAEARARLAAQALASELKEAADFVPAARVVQSRLLVEGVPAAVATQAPGDLETFGAAIEDETVELRRLAAEYRERRVSVATSQRGAAREECEKLIAVVPSSTAKRLKALLERLERAGASEVQAARRELERASSEVRNRIRLDAARTIRIAERSLARGEGKGAPRAGTDVDSTAALVRALQQAMDGDDVEFLARHSRKLKQALRTSIVWNRPLVRVAIAAVGVLLLVTSLFAWQWYTSRTREYRLTFSGIPASAEHITISLVRAGKIAEQDAFDPGQPAIVRLSPGEYEIYVNGRYTGRVVRVPGDPQDVTEIPFP